ncbi:MAG: WYL domain-containing protein [Desulfobulbaceae bacterium]|nr:WYL domain-containing protein [Desulfobulbaceae bacterium]
MSVLERVFFFHQEILHSNYPNSRDIAEQFEVSLPTAKRDIVYLRDRLLAPLTFNPQQNGYYYENEDFHLPFEESPRIVFLLAMLGKLAEEAGLGKLKEVKQLEQRLLKMITSDYSKIVDTLQVQWIEVESIGRKVFEAVFEAVIKNKLVSIRYKSVDGNENNRDVAPLQIINYQGRWYLFAFCTLRQADRLFHMGRIGHAQLSAEPVPTGIHFDQEKLDRSFGIFQGEPRYHAEILFTSTAAELVSNQHWHKDQQLKNVDQGIILRVPVSDAREIVMKILQYGQMAKVISPPELVHRVAKEISAMAARYNTEEDKN